LLGWVWEGTGSAGGEGTGRVNGFDKKKGFSKKNYNIILIGYFVK
jgi:hypothetical protein